MGTKSIRKWSFDRLRTVLATVYLEREKAEVGELWRVTAMTRIRRLGPLSSPTYLELVEPLVWRLAPVTFALALLLGAVLIRMDFVSDYEIVRTLVEDPSQFGLTGLLPV